MGIAFLAATCLALWKILVFGQQRQKELSWAKRGSADFAFRMTPVKDDTHMRSVTLKPFHGQGPNKGLIRSKAHRKKGV